MPPFRSGRRPARPWERGGGATYGYLDPPTLTYLDPPTGNITGGTAVTIYGTNFRLLSDGTVPTVLFGANAATSVLVTSRTTITCVTSATVTSGAVNVSVMCGSQTGTLVGGFTYLAGVITSIVPAYGPVAGGTAILITGTNFVTGSTITIGGVSATGVIFIDQQHYKAITPANTQGFYDVAISSPTVATARNGFQYVLLARGVDFRSNPGITIKEVTNNAPNSCTVTIDGTSRRPVVGEALSIVDVFDSNNLLFAGNVQTVEQIYQGEPSQLAWNVTALDPTWMINKYRPLGSFVNTSASLVVIDLVNQFAPGFTASSTGGGFVQANLSPVTISFDGTTDFATCLTNLAKAIGNGHWYVDYQRAVHFFHTEPPVIAQNPVTFELIGTPMTIAVGAAVPGTTGFAPGVYLFRHTFVYSDGSESALRCCSNVLILDGLHQVVFANLELGVTLGALTCVTRRIYMTRLRNGLGNLAAVEQVVEVLDNTTTGFTTFPGAVFDGVVLGALAITVPLPKVVVAGYPAGPVAPPQAALTVVQGPAYWNYGTFAFRCAYLYRDGSISRVGPPSNITASPALPGYGVEYHTISNVPIGPTVNSVDVIARLIFEAVPGYPGTFGAVSKPTTDPAWTASTDPVVVVPDNTTASVLVEGLDAIAFQAGALGYALANRFWGHDVRVVGLGGISTAPVWPNPDGPNLEATLPVPSPIDSHNVYALFDPGLTVSVDASQIRNRVTVIGAGSTLTLAVSPGDLVFSVADVTAFSNNGGTVIVNGQTSVYVATQGVIGVGLINLLVPATAAIPSGAVVANYFRADDTDSQHALSSIELDANGNPTDGVHESVIIDTSLTSGFQLFMRANAELEQFSQPITTITYSTRDPKTRAGATVHVDRTNPPCVGDFLIQDVTIDQVLVNDQLMPRYAVTAMTAARFNFNDFLLTLQSGTAATGNTSVAGLVQAAQPVSHALDLTLKNAWAFVVNNSATPNYVGVGCSPSAIGTAVTAFDPLEVPAIGDPMDTLVDNYAWTTHATSATAGNTSGVIVTLAPGQQLEQTLDLVMYVKTGAVVNNALLWAGLTNFGSVPVTAGGSNIALCAFRYLNGTDGGWVGVLQPTGVGHSQYVTSALVNCAPNTYYKLRIRSFGGSTDGRQTSVAFSVNDGPETSVSYVQTATPLEVPDHQMPIASGTQNAALIVLVGVCNNENAVKKFSWRYLTLSSN